MQHQWSGETSIKSGRQGKKASQGSKGYICSRCRMTAKAPTKPKKDWTPPEGSCS